MTTAEILVEIALRFATLSLVAIGGINAILPEIHRVVVDVEGWMSSAEFAELFALAQLSPGPNAMIVALVGWKVAGVAGALVATLAACGPSSVACYVAWHWADRLRQSKLRAIVQRALAPIAIGSHPGKRLHAGTRRRPLARRVRAHRCRDRRAGVHAHQSGLDPARGRRGRRRRARLTTLRYGFLHVDHRAAAARRTATARVVREQARRAAARARSACSRTTAPRRPRSCAWRR